MKLGGAGHRAAQMPTNLLCLAVKRGRLHLSHVARCAPFECRAWCTADKSPSVTRLDTGSAGPLEVQLLDRQARSRCGRDGANPAVDVVGRSELEGTSPAPVQMCDNESDPGAEV